jgi:hypothetical protein
MAMDSVAAFATHTKSPNAMTSKETACRELSGACVTVPSCTGGGGPAP